jgi:GDP/UDP-N,N'-diacetylbacillosamine 2-epimerase (hydrolysing)
MRKKIGVLTATRAEFGLLKPLILRLMKEDIFETQVLVTGAHLCPEFGYTYKEIEEAGIPIAARIECVTNGDESEAISRNMAMALEGFGTFFAQNKLDLLIVLGDRYETMAVCIAAMNAEIPIAHIHGGELTEGAVDEAIRHSITKMSHLHFTSTEVYRKRVIQLGEEPDRVFNVGALAVENTRNNNFLTRQELETYLDFEFMDKMAVVTFHPVTLDDKRGISQFEELLTAIDEFKDISFIITKANADAGGRAINERIDEFADMHDNVIAVSSLGVRRYLSAVNESVAVIGNSSSGITEAPCLHTPTVNIGDRQRGRIMPDSVLCCKPVADDIVRTIQKAISDKFQEQVQTMSNPFGDGNTSESIVAIIKEAFNKGGHIDVVKTFYDLDN